MPQEPLHLRGHHLLCAFGFRGLGYGREFVENMERIVKVFFAPEGVEIELLAGPDDICGACPRLQEEGCGQAADAEPRTRARDIAVLERLGLKEGERRTSIALRGLVARRFDPALLRRTCAGCGWLDKGYCEKGLEAFQQKLSRGDGAGVTTDKTATTAFSRKERRERKERQEPG